MQAERDNLFSMIEDTTDKATRGILLAMLALLDEISSQRIDFVEHQKEEMRKWDAMIGTKSDQEKHKREHAYLDEAIQAQQTRKAWRNAVIEKSLAGLVWLALASFVGFLGKSFLEYIGRG